MLPFWIGVFFVGQFYNVLFWTALPLPSWRPVFALGGGCKYNGQQVLSQGVKFKGLRLYRVIEVLEHNLPYELYSLKSSNGVCIGDRLS